MPLPIKTTSNDNLLTRVISKQMILDNIDAYRDAISFYRWYPDKLVDMYIQASGSECNFELLDFQRIFLRAFARYKEVFLTFSRGTSKSFIDDLWNILECILYPNTKLAIAATTKGQSGAILEAKVTEILNLLPILRFEIRKVEKIKDSFTVYFKNGSQMQNLAAKASSRGLRFTGVTLEEIIEGDPDIIQEVILPTLAIQRRAANGKFNPDEIITQQKICVTTAGYKDTYAYHSLIRTLLTQVTQPGKAIILGGSYKIPIIAGLQNMDFIRQQKNSGTFNPTSFGREYLSRWSTGSEHAYFPAEIFDRYRSLQEPVFEREENLGKGVNYIMAIDVGRFSDQSEVIIWKYIPQTGTTSTKHLVNLCTFEKMHFAEQAIEIKLLYEKYKPERVVIDGSGLGAGLVDELIKPHVDVRTNQYLRPWGVMNDDKGYYTQFKSNDMIPQLLYIIKATAPFNTEMYANLQTQLTTGKLRFLTDERQAKMKIDASRAKKFKEMTDDERIDWILPFSLTSILKDQMMNLEQKNDGINIILDRTNKNIKKDKVSAMGYGLWYIKIEIDDRAMMRNHMSLDQMLKAPVKGNSKMKDKNLTFRGNRSYSSNLRKKKSF
jgi:hypothetical protein